MPRKFHILVCKGPDCGERLQSVHVFDALQRELKNGAHNPPGQPPSEVILDRYSCFGQCKRGVNVLVREMKPTDNPRLIMLMPNAAPGALVYHGVEPSDAKRILGEHVAKGRVLDDLVAKNPPKP